MRSPIILPGQAKTAGILTVGQMHDLIRALAKIQPARVEMQLSLLARTLVISAKASGISHMGFFGELQKIWDETTGKELGGPDVAAAVPSVGLQPTGRN